MANDDREARLREEFALHIELATEANIRRGMAPEAARRAALIEFGVAEQFKDQARDHFRSPALFGLAQDLRYAARAARRAPLLTAVAVLTLTVAITLSTAAFTAVNGVLFRALPYPDPSRLALVWGTTAGKDALNPVSFTNASDWRAAPSFDALATFSCVPRPIVAGQGEPARAAMMDVSLDFFRVLGARPIYGRLFDSADYGSGPAPVVLTYPLWQQRFGSDPSIVGRAIQVDGVGVTVAGVLAPEFMALPASLACHPDLYRALGSRYRDDQRRWSFLRAVGRLKPGASVREAQGQIDVINGRLAERLGDVMQNRGARVVGFADYLQAPLKPTLVFLQIGALLVLLVAAANVAGLLLARGTVRRREFSIRTALGASTQRLARQAITESTLLGATAAALAVVATGFLLEPINGWIGNGLPDPRGLAIDGRVLAFTVAASMIATVVFGLAGVATATGRDASLVVALREGGRGLTGERSPLRRAIVAAQIAIAAVALVGAGLLARSYSRLRDIAPGFDPSNVLTARVALPAAAYPRGARQVLFFRQLLADIGARSDVAAAGAVSILPESPNFDQTNMRVTGRAYAPGTEPTPDVYRVTPGYFPAMRIALIAGRLFTDDDDDVHPPVAIINQTAAQALFPGETAVGRQVFTGAGNEDRTIVGVVADVYQYGLDKARTMQLYVPHADNSGGDLTLVVRGKTGAAGLSRLVQDALRAADPGVPADDVLTMDAVLGTSATSRRVLAALSLCFALGAIALAMIGLHGVIAYSVAQRTREIGVRMALGATAGDVAGHILQDVGRLVASGVGAGLVLALSLVQLMTPLLFGVTPRDVPTFVAAPIALLVLAAVAAALPARRATRVDPVVALRHD